MSRRRRTRTWRPRSTRAGARTATEAFLRSKPPAVPSQRCPARRQAALALGRPLGAAPPAGMSGNPACAESDDEPEYVSGLMMKDGSADVAGCGQEETRRGSRAEAQKGRPIKKARKAAQLEQQKTEERQSAEPRAAALAAARHERQEEQRRRSGAGTAAASFGTTSSVPRSRDASARRHAAAAPSTRPSETRASREPRACDHPRHPELRRVASTPCDPQAMEVDEATQATENVQRHVNALTGAHLEPSSTLLKC